MGKHVVFAARQGTLISILRKPLGWECADLVEQVLMPYCQWPASVKRRYGDDFDAWELADDRNQLLPWILFPHVVFYGFFSPLEICMHLAHADLQARNEHLYNSDNVQRTFSRLTLSKEQVDSATTLLNLFVDRNVLKNEYGNDLVRMLLDKFLPFSRIGKEDTHLFTPHLCGCDILMRQDELETTTHIAPFIVDCEKCQPYWHYNVGEILQKKWEPRYTIYHPEYVSRPPPVKKARPV